MTQLLLPNPAENPGRPRPGAVVETVSPAPRDIWRGVLRDDPAATALQTPEYFDAVVTGTGGSDVSRFYQLRDGRQLVLPLVRHRSRSGPALDAGYPAGYGHAGVLATGGLLAEDVSAVVKDLREASRWVRIRGAHTTTEQRSAGPLPGVVEDRRRAAVIELAPEHARDLAVFRLAYLDRETRQELRQATRTGVTVEKDSTGRLIPICYDVYRAWVEREVPRSGLPPLVARRLPRHREPYAKLATVAAGTGDACRVFVAWFQGRPVAASILLVHGQHALAWRTYHREDPAVPPAAGRLALVTGLEDAVRSGCRSLDLGRSAEMTGLATDWNPLGAFPRSVIDLRIEPAGLARLRAARGRAEGVLVRALTRFPAGPTPGQPQP